MTIGGTPAETKNPEGFNNFSRATLLALFLPVLVGGTAGLYIYFASGFGQWALGYVPIGLFLGLLVGGVLFFIVSSIGSRKVIDSQRAAQRDSLSVIPNAVGAGSSNRLSPFAVLSLVFSLLVAPIGIIFGHIAIADIRRTRERGRGLAVAGLVVGYLWTAGLVTILVVALVSR